MQTLSHVPATWITLAVLALAVPAMAFNPPVDQAGPLTVRIEGPTEVTETGVALPVRVVIENSGDAALSGTVRLGVIDQWQVEPADAVVFQVDASGTTVVEFTVTAGDGTFNALYPIHAFVDFRVGDDSFQAHPVLIVETQLPNPPEPVRNIEWAPTTVRVNTALALNQVPVRRLVFHEFGMEPRTAPPGWQGVDERTRGQAAFDGSVVRGDSRRTISMHPPWHQGRIGIVVAEYPLELPSDVPIRLNFAVAIADHRPETEPPSDGVTFRVRTVPFDAPDGELGPILFERHTDAKVWEDASVDLSDYAGQSIRLQLESHPGPKNDTTCDRACWAEPTVVAGTPSSVEPPANRPKMLEGVLKLGDESHLFSIRPGARGLLDATVEVSGEALSFDGFAVKVAGADVASPGSTCVLTGVQQEPADRGCRMRHRFDGWMGSFDVVVEMWANGPALQASFCIENAPEPEPWRVTYLERVSVGPWSQPATRVYAGPGNVIETPDDFTLSCDGHQVATSFVGMDFDPGPSLVLAVDVPPDQFRVESESRTYTLDTPHAQTLTIIPAENVWDAVKVWRDLDTRTASAGVPKVAGRFVFDLWGGHYGSTADALERAFRYGLTDAMVVWHNWQRWGYDYRLPDICPPNPAFGTVDEFRALAHVCADRDVIFAPHDNYIDFYPDATGYSYDHIAFTRDRQPIRAWLNEGRDAQAYRWRPDRVRPFLEQNIEIIKAEYPPTGYFIDVWSSIRPHDYWTHDGQFFDRVYTRTEWGELFAWIRDYLGDDAPQISESGHDQLIGWLDGAQANHLRVDANPPGGTWFTWRIGCVDSERIPWFDAAHHAKFVLHGAGYPGRYAGGLPSQLHGVYSDDYVATEILTGRPAMVSRPFGRDVVRKYWLVHDIGRALAPQDIDSVEFVGDNIHRQHVQWDNGAKVWVNRGNDDWTVNDHVLPEYGFYGKTGTVPSERVHNAVLGVSERDGTVPFFHTAIERIDGVIVEWAASPDSLYCNARPVVEECEPISVAVEGIDIVGPRALDIRFRWHADRPLPERYQVFVHLVDDAGKICLQADHPPPVPTTEWRGEILTTGRVTIPDAHPLGTSYDMRIGLYTPGGGTRPRLRGPEDGERRIRLGAVTLEGADNALTGVPFEPTPEEPNPVLARMNSDGLPIAFGPVTTNGACRIRPDGSALAVTPLPDGPPFTVRIRWDDLPWRIPKPTRITAVYESGEIIDSAQVAWDNDELVLTCKPDVFEYKLLSEYVRGHP